MSSIQVTISEDLRRLNPDGIKRSIQWWQPRGALLSRNEMVRQIGARTKTVGRTGFLRKSVTTRLIQGGFVVYPTAAYSIFVDQPTRPHDIRPRHAKALAFARSGGILSRSNNGNVQTRFMFGSKQVKTSVIFAQVVHHPGTRGAFYEAATATAIVSPLAELMDRSLKTNLGTS